MSGLDRLTMRLQYGGGNAEGRMQKAKLDTLKKSLLYSYQAETAVLADGRKFRCLINPDKVKQNYDDKIISIPYADICLGMDEDKPKPPTEKTSEGLEIIGMKPGDVFRWERTNTYWLVYLEFLEEDSYFRAEIRRCDFEVDIDGKKYRSYIRGPEPGDILWHTKKNISWNELNYDAVMYITKDEHTEQFFHRFSKIEINGKPWEVQMVDNFTTLGIIEVGLKETYQNSILDEKLKEDAEAQIPEEPGDIDETLPHIIGDAIVYPYDKKIYQIDNNGGYWELSNKKAKITKQTDTEVAIEVITSRSGSFDLIYKKENEDDIVFSITIKSL